MDSEGDEVDDGPYDRDGSDTAVNNATGNGASSISYYVCYAVNIEVSPAEPQDTLAVSAACLVSHLTLLVLSSA